MSGLNLKQMKELKKKGIIDSVEYYASIEDNIFPLLDYLETSQIKRLSKWLGNTYRQMTKETNHVPNVGNEYIIAVQAYLGVNGNRVATAWTRKVFTEDE